MTTDEGEVRLTLRMPSSIRDKLAGAADKSGRSLNAEIVSRLERSIDFEDEYGTLEDVFRDIWNDIEKLQSKVSEHDEQIRLNRYVGD